MSDKDIWDAYANNRRENKHRLTDMYMHVLKEDYDYDNANYMSSINSKGEEARAPHDPVQMRKLLIQWIRDAGFDDIEGSVVARLEFAFNNYQGATNFIDILKLEEHIDNKNKPVLPTATGPLNLVELIKGQIENICYPGTPENVIIGLYNYLFSITFAESTVSVGRGELILTLFTQCVKGSVGDIQQTKQERDELASDYGINTEESTDGLKQGNEQIEVKTGKGRAVSARGGMFKQANYAIERAVLGKTGTAAGTETYELSDKAGNVVAHVRKVIEKKGTKEIEKYEPIEDGETVNILTVDQFLKALQLANIGKLKPFAGESAEQIRGFLEPRESKMTDTKAIQQLRNDVVMAALLWTYANPGKKNKGFNKLLAIYQHGQTAAPTKGRPTATMSGGSFSDAYMIDCSSIQSIYEAMQSGVLTISRGGYHEGGKTIDGEGVYIGYGDSNTEITALGHSAPHYQQ